MLSEVLAGAAMRVHSQVGEEKIADRASQLPHAAIGQSTVIRDAVCAHHIRSHQNTYHINVAAVTTTPQRHCTV